MGGSSGWSKLSRVQKLHNIHNSDVLALEKVEVLHMFRISPSQSYCIHKFHRRVSDVRPRRKIIPISVSLSTNFLISANHNTNLSKCNTFIDSQQRSQRRHALAHSFSSPNTLLQPTTTQTTHIISIRPII